MRIPLVAASLALACPLTSQSTASWPQFLGAETTAHASGASTLSFDRDKDLHYRVELPPGESSPCILSCVDAVTGKPRFRRARLDDHSEYYATPLGVDGHVVVCSSGGTVYVLEAADELKIVREVAFDERIFATPAVVDGTVYVRTRTALYAFAHKE